MSVFKLPEPSPTLPRNGFDLSSRRVFSAPAGVLLPVFTAEVNPGEHFKMRVQDLVRTQPLNTAAFARCKEYYHFFFVPYKALWSSSDKFFTGVSNGDSAYIAPKSIPDYGQDTSSIGKSQTFDIAYNNPPKSVPSFNLIEAVIKLNSLKDSSENYDSLGFNLKYGGYRLLNLLEYGLNNKGKVVSSGSFDEEVGFDGASQSTPNVQVSAFRLLAYQRIYNDFYRNDQWQKADPLSFNVDYLYQGGQLDPDVIDRIFTLRYRWLQKDWLTSSLPTAIYNEGIFNLPSTVAGVTRSEILHTSDAVILDKTGDSHNRIGLTVSDIKAAFALNKMLEATRRANGLDYSSQIAAHFGFKVPESRRNCAQFIGGFDNAIAISEVVTTSNGSVDGTAKTGSVVGQMFGKGIGSMDSGSLEFDAKEHGVIMCIYSIAPQVDYNATSLSPFNRKLAREDYFQPEFMNLGLQPILESDVCFTDDPSYNNQLLAYTSRYAEYKSNRDIVFGEFQSYQTLSAWTTPRFQTTADKQNPATKDYYPYISPSSLMVDPRVLDPIFSVAYNGNPETDQFMINSYFDVKAVRPMSVVGSMNL